jgi:hypothetical protein
VGFLPAVIAPAFVFVGFSLVFVGLRGVVTRKPFLVRAKWLNANIAVILIALRLQGLPAPPILIEGKPAVPTFSLWLDALMALVVVVCLLVS